MTRATLPIATLSLIACQLIACQPSEPAAPPAPLPPATSMKLPAGHPPIDSMMQAAPSGAPVMPGAAGGKLSWTAPSGWVTQQPASSMRQAQFGIPKAGGDAEDAQLVVFYFGAGQGGDVQSNVDRWLGQFQGANGVPVSKTEKRLVGTMPVTIVSTEGTYGGGMAMPGAPESGPKAGYALLGAIAETPAGPWFFKMTGPQATVKAARPAFDAFVSSFKAQ